MNNVFHRRRRAVWLWAMLILALAACGLNDAPATEGDANAAENGEMDGETTAVAATQPPLDPTYAARIAAERSPDVPDLPFPDNPDPSQCGIPIEWGQDEPAWLNGRYQGEMVQSTVYLYDSHLRLNVTAKAPHGQEVEVLLYQENPVIDYYFVKIKGAEQPNEGWAPAPFLSFTPVEG
jgi:hypothetical protein